MSYYSPGDRVIYKPKNIDAKIISSLPNDEYVVEWDNNQLIPPQMTVPGYSLIPKPLPIGFADFYGQAEWNGNYDPSFNRETQCPRCGSPWKETWIGHKAYYDCLKCNLKKEDA